MMLLADMCYAACVEADQLSDAIKRLVEELRLIREFLAEI